MAFQKFSMSNKRASYFYSPEMAHTQEKKSNNVIVVPTRSLIYSVDLG